MTSLLDIGPLTEEISVGGTAVTVNGLSPEGFFYLLEKFPGIRSMFGGGVKNVDMNMLNEVGPMCVAHALALATTDRTRYASLTEWKAAIETAAKVAVNLPATYQMALFQAALRLTFPDGIGPFIKGVEVLANSINQVSGVAPAMTSSKQSRSGFHVDSPGLRLGPGRRSASSAH